jgi:PIN domain nuclease of toxin-antitoxin system
VKLLLDTHIWIWSLVDPSKLGKRVASALVEKENELWLSPISVWEALLLVEKGRLEIVGSSEDWIEKALSTASYRDAQINHAVATESRRVHLDHADPADRFLAASAVVYDLVLVTADARLLKARGFHHMANR